MNLFPRDTAAIAALDSPGSCTFNNGICEAQFSALEGLPTVSCPLKCLLCTTRSSRPRARGTDQQDRSRQAQSAPRQLGADRGGARGADSGFVGGDLGRINGVQVRDADAARKRTDDGHFG